MDINEQNFWEMVYNRQQIFYERYHILKPTVKDEILTHYKFTNMYRILDRTTQYLLKEVIKPYSRDLKEVLYRVLLFKLYNKAETWEVLKNEGYHELDNFNFEEMRKLLEEYNSDKKVNVYNNAYYASWGMGVLSHYKNMYEQHLFFMQWVMDNTDIYEEIYKLETLKDCYRTLKALPMVGSFVAYQLCLDLSYHSSIPFTEDNWTQAGPGAHKGLDIIFGSKKKELIHQLQETQTERFNELGLDFKFIELPNGEFRKLSISDIEHALCEFHKYEKYKDTMGTGRRLGRVYRPVSKPLVIEYPKKWYCDS